MGLTVAISRADTDLTLPGSAPSEGLWAESLTRARITWRRNRVTSDWLDGAPQTSAVKDVSELAMVAHAKSADPTTLRALVAEFEAAVDQWSFTLTATEDGAPPVVYSCDCADYDPSPYTFGRAAAGVVSWSLTIPCHPIPGA